MLHCLTGWHAAVCVTPPGERSHTSVGVSQRNSRYGLGTLNTQILGLSNTHTHSVAICSDSSRVSLLTTLHTYIGAGPRAD